jgi:putative spermidine/putrescine transport system permease protein
MNNKRHAFINDKKHGFLSVIAYTAVLSIVIPCLILPAWSFMGRWPWPGLLPQGFTLRGMEELFSGTSNLFSILFSSIMLSLTVAFLAALIGMMTARALLFYNFKGRKLISFAAVLPIIVPGTAFAMGIHVVFLHLGLADTFTGVVLVHLIYTLPYTVNIMTDVTASVGDGLELQGQVLGASPVQAFFRITLPLILPGVISSASMAYIISFSQYFLTLMIGGGKIKTLSIVMVPFIQSGDRTIASSYALVFVVSTLLIFLLFEFLAKMFTSRMCRIS